ncbi:MAG: hypothetical protein RL347_966 [Actinomycetota bacterium]|jgi:uncharacterized membrane protein
MLDDLSEDQPAPKDGPDVNPWTQRFYQRGTQGFERVIFFSDAVYAISLTLIAVQLVLPALTDLNSSNVGQVIVESLGNIWAYAFTFIWVALYWKANHRFTLTLRRMNDRYIWAVLIYLAFIALLPLPAALLGEEWDPRALAFFFVYMACVSLLEVLMMVIAIRDDLLVRSLNREERRRWILTSLSPVVAALVAAPMAFVTAYGNYLAIATMAVLAFGLSALVRRRYPAAL